MLKKRIKNCDLCEVNLSFIERPVYSDVIKKFFCSLDCYKKYKEIEENNI